MRPAAHETRRQMIFLALQRAVTAVLMKRPPFLQEPQLRAGRMSRAGRSPRIVDVECCPPRGVIEEMVPTTGRPSSSISVLFHATMSSMFALVHEVQHDSSTLTNSNCSADFCLRHYGQADLVELHLSQAGRPEKGIALALCRGGRTCRCGRLRVVVFWARGLPPAPLRPTQQHRPGCPRSQLESRAH